MRIDRDITEQFYGIAPQEIGEIVIFTCFDRLRDYERNFRDRKCSRFQGYYSGLNIDMEESRLSVIYSGSGDSRLGDAVLALKYTGCRKALYCGAAGGLSADTPVGSFFIAEEAVSRDGFTALYVGENTRLTQFSDQPITTADPYIVRLFDNFRRYSSWNAEYMTFGRMVTLDSVFYEDDDFLLYAKQNDCIAVDLETSAFYTSCALLSISGMAFHFISDRPSIKQDFNFFHSGGLRSFFKQSNIISTFLKLYWNDLMVYKGDLNGKSSDRIAEYSV